MSDKDEKEKQSEKDKAIQEAAQQLLKEHDQAVERFAQKMLKEREGKK